MALYEFKEEDAIRFATRQGGKIRESSKEIKLQYCPYCHGGDSNDKFTFAINKKTGAFNCLRASCGAKGNMITLSRDFDFSLGDQVDAYYRKERRSYKTLPNHKPEPKDRAISYLAGRGISEDIARKYNITISNKDEKTLCFPFYDENNVLRFIKYRNIEYKKGDPGNKEWCEANCKPILFGMNHCDPEAGPLILTEGQIDSLSVAECGIPNTVSVPNGKNGFTWLPHCWEFIQKFNEIIVFGDCERGEITLLDEMAKRFRGEKTVKHVRIADYLGHKDANELLQEEGRDAVINAVSNAEPVLNPRIKRVADIKRIDMSEIGGIDTGFTEIDEKLERLYFGQLILLTGERGDGKSTLSMQLGARAVDAGIPTMFYSAELQEYTFREWIERHFAGKRHINALNGNRYRIDSAVLPQITEWYADKLYLYDEYDVDPEDHESLLDTLRESIVQYGCRVLIIDNLMTAMDDDMANDLYRQQTAFVRALSRMAKTYNVIVILIAHPKKKDKDKMFDNDDVSGSANITNLCDTVLRYARPAGSPDTQDRLLSILKNRINGRTNYKGVKLYFEECSKRISAVEGLFDMEYGWERDHEKDPAIASFANVDDEDLESIPF